MVHSNEPISIGEIPTQDNSTLAIADNRPEEISIGVSPSAQPSDCFNDHHGTEGLCTTSYQGTYSLIIQAK